MKISLIGIVGLIFSINASAVLVGDRVVWNGKSAEVIARGKNPDQIVIKLDDHSYSGFGKRVFQIDTNECVVNLTALSSEAKTEEAPQTIILESDATAELAEQLRNNNYLSWKQTFDRILVLASLPRTLPVFIVVSADLIRKHGLKN